MFPYIKVISDIHEEFKDPLSPMGHFRIKLPDKDTDKNTILIVAGDIANYSQEFGVSKICGALERLGSQYLHVVACLGNHDYWFSTIENVLYECKEYIEKVPNVTLLENESISLYGINFFGSTFWSDFDADPLSSPSDNNTWVDCRLIHNSIYDKMTCYDFSRRHEISVYHLKEFLKTDKKGPVVVISHHLPSHESTPSRFKGVPENKFFSTDQTPLMLEEDIDLWVHGHTHDSFDYYVGSTKVVCNPYGYHGHELNSQFNENLLLEIDEDFSVKTLP